MTESIGSLRAEMSLNTIELKKDLTRARKDIRTSSKKMSKDFGSFQKTVDSTIRSIKGFGGAVAIAAGATGLALLVKNSIEATQQIGKVADKIGISTDALQEYRQAASFAGVEQRALDMGLQRFTRRVAEAAQGSGELSGTLKQYGIAVRNADGSTRDTLDVLDDLADTIQGAESEAEQLRIAFKAFDSEGAAMVNLFKKGSAGAEELRQKTRDLGIVIDEDLVRNAEKAQDSLDALTSVLKANLTRAVLVLAPEIVAMADAFLTSDENVEDFKETMSGVGDVLRGAVAGVGVTKNVFDIVGKSFAATGARLLFALEGDFAAAQNVLDQFNNDLKGDVADIGKIFDNLAKNKTIFDTPTVKDGGKDVVSPRGEQLKNEIDLTKMLIDETNKLLENERAAAQTRASANETLFRELGLNGEEYFNDQANDILEQASKWKAAGVKIENVNEFLTAKLVELQKEAEEKGVSSLDSLIFRATQTSEDVLQNFEDMKAGAVSDLQEIGFAATMLDANDVSIDIQLNDAATIGIENLISRVEALKASLSTVSGGLVDVEVNGAGDVPATGDNVSNVYISQQLSRSDVDNITVEQNRQAVR